MTSPLSLDLKQKQSLNLKQMQRLIMSPQMQQALHMLQLPVMELSPLIEAELEQNPVLEVLQEEPTEDATLQALEEDALESPTEEEPPQDKSLDFKDNDLEILQRLDEEYRDFFNESQPHTPQTQQDEKLRTFLENSICAHTTLADSLMNQAREVFTQQDELKMAEVLIEDLNDQGLLTTPVHELAELNAFDEINLRRVLKQIQTFDPSGVGAENLQQALLIQLTRLGKKESLAYQVVDSYFNDLIHNQIPNIQKHLGCTLQEIGQAIREDIAKLDLHPGTTYTTEPVQTITPDVILKQEGDQWRVEANNDYVPNFRFNRKYLRMLEDESLSLETKEFIRSKIVSAKWLMKNIFHRNTTLERITELLAKKQAEFFLLPDGKLVPLTMKTLAEELEVHESTIARAVANKYVDSPRGILALRSFFTNTYVKEGGEEISSQTVRNLLLEIIKSENKNKPLSDESIAKQIKAKGIDCARRTVAKYRAELNLGNAHQRRRF